MLKYNFWRTSPPQRDWNIDTQIDLATINFATETPLFEGFRDRPYVAEMFCWLCGLGEEFDFVGGQGWPYRARDTSGRAARGNARVVGIRGNAELGCCRLEAELAENCNETAERHGGPPFSADLFDPR